MPQNCSQNGGQKCRQRTPQQCPHHSMEPHTCNGNSSIKQLQCRLPATAAATASNQLQQHTATADHHNNKTKMMMHSNSWLMLAEYQCQSQNDRMNRQQAKRAKTTETTTKTTMMINNNNFNLTRNNIVLFCIFQSPTLKIPREAARSNHHTMDPAWSTTRAR